VTAPTSLSQKPISTFRGLAPLVIIVFLGYLAVGVPLAALALYVHDTLGFSPLVVGIMIGMQSIVTVLTRHRAGTFCDHHGPRWAALAGLPIAVLSGALYVVAAHAPVAPLGVLAIILAGRVAMGLGESLFIVGTMSWGIGRLGPARTGRVMSWQGIAMYGAMGIGAPLGLAVQSAAGFAAVGLVAAAAPLLALAIAAWLPATPLIAAIRAPFLAVLGLIWRPGLIVTLATAPFATMATFLALYFARQHWSGAGLALTGFGGSYVLVRLAFSHLPDRLGGRRVAAACLVVECIGQAILWLAPMPAVAIAGATISGLGFSLIFPAMGVAATKSIAPGLRGQAVGNFIAFFDLAIGATGPVVGVVVGYFGLSAAFAVGLAAALAALALVPRLR
jgi:MFS family permease